MDPTLPESGLRGTIRDFIMPIVEFLGILVPGVIFVFAFLPAVLIPLASLLQIAESATPKLPIIGYDVIGTFLSPGAGTIFVLCVFSYVVGHIFFRQDPKIPDQHSFKRVRSTIKEEGPVRLSNAERKFNDENNLENDYNLEFPYRYLHEYLTDRGMLHLAEMIPWRGNDPKTYKLRTKHFVNVLKVRLEFLFPYQYLRIQRNEAHVRLMSSMWYAAKSLELASVVGIGLGLTAMFLCFRVTRSIWPIPYAYSVALPIVVLVISKLTRRHINGFLHYQRIREIVFILESAFFAKKIYPKFNFVESESTTNKPLDKTT